jgi:hypothetical protein
VAIYGDHPAFEGLYDALHTVTGDEDEFISFESARMRVLGVCYDIRHALLGDRDIEFVDNGMTEDKMKRLATITHNKNIYLTINVYWPEMLFVTMALNDFLRLYAGRKAKRKYDVMVDKQNIWDPAIAQVRNFQAALAECIRGIVSEASFSRMLNLMNKDYTWLEGYTTQYVDILNCQFFEMDKEKRLKTIPTLAKRLTEQGDEYQQIKKAVFAAAREYNCPVDDIESQVEYPEDIEW